MISSIEKHMIARAEWRGLALAKLAELASPIKNPTEIQPAIFAYFLSTNAMKPLVDHASHIETLSHLPAIAMAWIIAMEAEGEEIGITPHRLNGFSDLPRELRDICLTIRTPWGQKLSVSPSVPWSDRYANYGEAILTGHQT